MGLGLYHFLSTVLIYCFSTFFKFIIVNIFLPQEYPYFYYYILKFYMHNSSHFYAPHLKFLKIKETTELLVRGNAVCMQSIPDNVPLVSILSTILLDFSSGMCLFKVNNGNMRTMCVICSKLIHIVLIFQLLTLNK